MQAIELKGVHFEIDDNLRKYVTKKLGRAEKYLPKHCRESAHMQVWLKETHSRDKKQCICELKLHVPGETIVVSESTMNMYAAVDIVQAKLKQQLTKYRELRTDGKHRRRMFVRFMRRAA